MTDLRHYRGLAAGRPQWTIYLWPFQRSEGGWLHTLSLLLIAATVWLVRRAA